jgi:hypothetical protein
MNYHKNIDETFLSFGIKQIDWKSLFDPTSPHSHEWINVSVNDIFTDEGLKFFADRNIKLRSTTRVFRLNPNFTCEIHVDSDYYDAAFNFVVEGAGEMQWVTVENSVETSGSYTKSDSKQGSFTLINDYTNLTVDDSWDGNCALVKISVPHRVIGGPGVRYCVSVRPTEDHFFDDLVGQI